MAMTRTTALLACIAIALMCGVTSHAQPIDQADETLGTPDQATLDHIETLEKLLRDAGVEPPPRPSELPPPAPVPTVQKPRSEEPILPPSFATVVFETEAREINARGDKSAKAIEHIRRWLTRDDVKRRVAAEDIVQTLTAWAEAELKRIKSTDDQVTAYMYADNAIKLFEQDPLAKPFKQYMMELRRDRSAYRELEPMAAYRRAMYEAELVGLLDDWDLIDFSNVGVRNTIKTITAKLTIITNHWPKSEGAELSQAKLDEWAEREAQAIADLPAWRYTWQMSLIQVGTETKTKVITNADGTVYISEDTDIVYDTNNVILNGSFQNTSDKPYRYTFLAAVAPSGFLKVPFTKLKKSQLSGYELVQTPVLQPGELVNWEVTVAVDNIRNLNRGGVTMVQVHERDTGR
jgi:hypothetical protein